MHAVIKRCLQLPFNLVGSLADNLVDSGARQPDQTGAATR